MNFNRDIHNFVINESIDESLLSPEDKWKLNHKRMHEKHKGHEHMHAWMLIILLTSVIVAQIILVEWKKRHYKSYQNVSLLGMWLIPLIVSICHGWWRFVIIWVVVTVLTCIVVSRAFQKPIAGTTPRLVYKWFYLIYMICYGLGTAGYVIMLLTLLGIVSAFGIKAQHLFDAGLMFLFYGFYYGVLGRDVAEIITDKMAATIGYYTTTGVPVRQLESNVCAVCGNRILVQDNSEAIVEKTFKLTCGHTFHEFCIRGWCIVGKKQTCPYCKEKVDLKRMFCHPWDKPHVFYANFLDFMRYLVVWLPLLFTALELVNYSLGLE